jgi:hypothetical protein
MRTLLLLCLVPLVAWSQGSSFKTEGGPNPEIAFNLDEALLFDAGTDSSRHKRDTPKAGNYLKIHELNKNLFLLVSGQTGSYTVQEEAGFGKKYDGQRHARDVKNKLLTKWGFGKLDQIFVVYDGFLLLCKYFKRE